MGKLFYLMGKSSSGKDSFQELLLSDPSLSLKRLVIYTTRPIRDGEKDGTEYYFVDRQTYLDMKEKGILIEDRTYHTVHGDWIYFTADNTHMDLSSSDYLGIGTLESFVALRNYYGEDRVLPIYIEVEDGERLARALYRERKQEHPKYAEMCRRFLSDQEDFSEEKIKEAGIRQRFQNIDRETCLQEIKEFILENAIHSQTV